MTQYGVTPRQYDLLKFISEYTAARGYSPSYDEMKAGLGIASKSGVARLVAGLEARNYLQRIPYLVRSIALVPETTKSLGLGA